MESLGVLPTRANIVGAWVVLVLGVLITAVTLAYTVMEIIGVGGPEKTCVVNTTAHNASHHPHNRSGWYH
jgi:hypothetical protein